MNIRPFSITDTHSTHESTLQQSASPLAVRVLGLIAGVTLATPVGFAAGQADAGYRIQLDTIHSGYDGVYCWVQPNAGIVPMRNGPPAIVMTFRPLWLKGSDVFGPMSDMRTDDLGRTWSKPKEHTHSLGERRAPDGTPIMPSDFWPKWHAKSGKLLGIGHTVYYDEKDGIRKVRRIRPKETSYSVYDPDRRTWSPWLTLEMPDEPRFKNAGAGCVQRVDLPNGDILLPIYHMEIGPQVRRASVLRCRFDGTTLSVVEVGNELSVPPGREVDRGMSEPSLTRVGSRYFLTLRNDVTGYVATSDDGLHFDTPKPWLWDDGTDLGNYNTQTHWVTHNDKLYLVYTRRGANNDHVFRHRAPLFIGEVDQQKLAVIRATERILVPERGARLGNFGVTEVSPTETWVTVAEWMQTWGPNFVMPVDNKYGADNSIYAARILWNSPDRNGP